MTQIIHENLYSVNKGFYPASNQEKILSSFQFLLRNALFIWLSSF